MHYRALWLSDLHLGTRTCSSDKILRLLHTTESDFLFLVGDIIDGWSLSRHWYWPKAHSDIIQAILRKVTSTTVVYIPGNHDEFARRYLEINVGGILVLGDYDYVTLRGKRLLVMHGDELDIITMNHRWLAVLGDIGYSIVFRTRWLFSWWRGTTHWSLSGFLKRNVNRAVAFLSKHEELVATSCAGRADGVICGHTHIPGIKRFGELHYYNCGDGVDSCTCLVETDEGEMMLLDYHTSPPTTFQREDPC